MIALDSIGVHLLYHFHSQVNTVFFYGSIIILDRFQIFQDILRNNGLAQSNNSFKTSIVLNGNNAWNYWTVDANRTAFLYPFQEQIHVEKQLSDDKVCTRVHLLLQSA